jgi:putative ABC transport system substrate-binding protein
VNRREFITLFSVAAAAWPRAQQLAMPVVGLLSPLAPGSSEHVLNAFRRGLGESGRMEGQNVAIESKVTYARRLLHFL